MWLAAPLVTKVYLLYHGNFAVFSLLSDAGHNSLQHHVCCFNSSWYLLAHHIRKPPITKIKGCEKWRAMGIMLLKKLIGKLDFALSATTNICHSPPRQKVKIGVENVCYFFQT